MNMEQFSSVLIKNHSILFLRSILRLKFYLLSANSFNALLQSKNLITTWVKTLPLYTD